MDNRLTTTDEARQMMLSLVLGSTVGFSSMTTVSRPAMASVTRQTIMMPVIDVIDAVKSSIVPDNADL